MTIRNDNDALYQEARLEIIQKFDYWNEADNPTLLSTLNTCLQLAGENYGKAYYLLSLLYDGKQDCAEDKDRARHFEKMAFDWSYTNRANEDAELWNDLGDLYRQRNLGEFESNAEQATFWFRKAAEKGYAESQYNLADAYRFGLGVAESLPEAIRWCERAVKQGHEMAIANLVHMKVGLTSP